VFLLMCFNSLLNFFIMFSLSSSFRHQILKLLFCGKKFAKKDSTVTAAFIRSNRVNVSVHN
jgi:hypothetical protein